MVSVDLNIQVVQAAPHLVQVPCLISIHAPGNHGKSHPARRARMHRPPPSPAVRNRSPSPRRRRRFAAFQCHYCRPRTRLLLTDGSRNAQVAFESHPPSAGMISAARFHHAAFGRAGRLAVWTGIPIHSTPSSAGRFPSRAAHQSLQPHQGSCHLGGGLFPADIIRVPPMSKNVIFNTSRSRPPMGIILHLAQRAPSTAGAARFFRAFGLDFYAVTVSKEAFFRGWDTAGRGLTVPALSSRFSGNSRLFLDILPRCSKIKILPPRQKSAYKPYTPKGE